MTIPPVQPEQQANERTPLLPSPVESQIAKLELALKLAEKRLRPYEEKYGVTSDHFISEMTAGDLTGGDSKYIHWVGDYQLRQRLQKKLNDLMADQYEQLMVRLKHVSAGHKFSREEMTEDY
jgi:hypothetical protein